MDAVAAQEEQIVADILRGFDREEKDRGIWDIHWEETSQKVLPYYSTSFFSKGNMTPGTKRQQNQYDVTANSALWKFAAAMESMLTPASSRWHRTRPALRQLKQDQDVMEWMDTVTDMLFHYRYSPHAGFQSNIHDGYVSLGAFGNSCLFVDKFSDPTQPMAKGLRYRQVHLGELYFNTNHQGQVDTVYRRFKQSLRQIEQRWPGKLPDSLKSMLETNREHEVFIVHLVRPNREFMPGRLDAKGKRFSSHYVLKDQRVLLEAGGYRCMPYAVSRYLTAPGEKYGRGPAMNVLASIKTLDEEKKMVLKQGHLALAPALLTHDDGIVDGITLTPGAVNPGGVSAEGRLLVQAIPTGNMQVGKELMDDERMAINDAFLVTIFQILVETPQMTATEVLERAREKGALLSPTMGRYQSESLGPMIERELDLLMDQGLIPPPPPQLLALGAEYKVEYDAPLNRAMRSEEAAGGMRTFQWAAEMAAQTQDPSVLDPINTDVMVPELADINGMPFRWLRTPDAIAAIRQGRQQDKAAAQVTQALPGMAAMAKASAPQGTSPNQGQPQ